MYDIFSSTIKYLFVPVFQTSISESLMGGKATSCVCVSLADCQGEVFFFFF